MQHNTADRKVVASQASYNLKAERHQERVRAGHRGSLEESNLRSVVQSFDITTIPCSVI